MVYINRNFFMKKPDLIAKELLGKILVRRIGNKELSIQEGENNFEIVESFRIGVKKDLDKPMRFYIKDNKWVSRI